jgi:predicted transcriptional regulator
MTITTNGTTNVQTDEINAEMIDYMTSHGKVSAKELSELVGITISSIRYRLFQLMGCGIVGQEKTRNYRVWFYVIEKEAASCANKMNGGDAGIPARRYTNNDNLSSGQ